MLKKILLISIPLLLLSGCWNYKDINTTRLVSGMAIDYDSKKDEYITTIEIVNLKAGKRGVMKGQYYQSRGSLPFEGVRDIIMKTGRRLYWTHAKVIIISEEIAKKKMMPILDYMHRDAEFREEIYFIVSKEKTAQEILEKYTAEEFSPILSYHMYEGIQSEKNLPKYIGTESWQFIKTLYEEGASTVLPTVENVEKNEEIYPILGGVAVFQKDHFVGYLTESETTAFLWAVDRIKGGLVTVDPKVDNQKVNVTLEILKNKTELKPIYKNGEIIMNIEIMTDVNIAEIDGSIDVIGKKGRTVLEKEAEKYIQNQVERVIHKVQKKYNSDIFQFSKKIKNTMPHTWKNIYKEWDKIFSEIKVNVEVKVHIQGSALQSKPIQIR
ncbi:Ger(x)C family spore germination protein [Inediibacterium massiliense]|uniref:Ger(x)C family spore germination protein n=1 Tax=Inediibacterium massiliense TaxID=1658111 RepID=UPI0006B5D997|nr:Ger(x)C family spore germination protein [Inediibacterium massiliense]